MSRQAKIAVYAGSFDPVTLGHVAIVERASRMFDQIHVVVGVSQDKRAWFSAEERVEMLVDACQSFDNINVVSHGGLTVEYAKKQGACALIRGLRSGADYTYECSMAQINRHLESSIETVFIPTDPEFFHISSSIVKDVTTHGGRLEGLVTSLVAQRLTEKTKD